MKMNQIYFATTSFPFSSDPIKYDAYIHHYSFTSVFAGLVTLLRSGQITPMLASRWEVSNDFMEWQFTIRKDLYYSNGDKITISDVHKNFVRVALLMKNTESLSGVLEFLVGFEKIKTAKSSFEGITIKDDKLIFRFIKPIPDFLEKVSFGFYSLAHPSLYNNENGEWLDDKKVISSGAYEVSLWQDKIFNLRLRKNVPYVDYENSIQEIQFKNLLDVNEANEVNKISILIGDRENLMVTNSFEFINSPNGINISYIRCYGCEKTQSPLSNLEVRNWFKKNFYDQLKKDGYNIITSFFPLVLSGVSEVKNDELIKKPFIPKFQLKAHKYIKHPKIIENINKIAPSEFIARAIYEISSNPEVEIILEEYNNSKKFSDFDLIAKFTGIEANDYMETVRFMFLSKQGIQLPDITGKIIQELKKENPNIQVINQELWDQSIIWPVRHFSNGLWVNKEHGIDYSQLNTNNPAIDFQFLKWK